MLEPETYIIPGDGFVTMGDPNAMPGTRFNLSPAESAALGLGQNGAKFEFGAAPAVAKFDQTVSSDAFKYSYRMDGGAWTPYRRSNTLEFGYLANGWHVIEVRAIDANEFTDATPARIEFYVDSVAPQSYLYQQEQKVFSGQGTVKVVEGDPVVIGLEDNVSDGSDICVLVGLLMVRNGIHCTVIVQP